jgi:hypothetical protein
LPTTPNNNLKPKRMSEEDIKHFIWLHERLIEVYKESENTNHLVRMRKIMDAYNPQ